MLEIKLSTLKIHNIYLEQEQLPRSLSFIHFINQICSVYDEFQKQYP